MITPINIKRNDVAANMLVRRQKRSSDQEANASSLYRSDISSAFKSYVNISKTTPINFLGSLPFDNTLNYFRFPADKYQKQAGEYIFKDMNTVVTAPTGTGKTLIGEYAINNNLAKGKRTFYTTPLKALTNQKYFDFCELFDSSNVGIMTGDIKHNIDAPIVVMTTEIYNNMLPKTIENKDNPQLSDLGTVVFDEFHYMDDIARGMSWEESIMFTPSNVQLLTLSATAANADKVADWVKEIHPSREIGYVSVPPEERHVPLKYYYFNEEIKPLEHFQVNIDKLGKLKEEEMPDRMKKALTDFANRFEDRQDSDFNDGIRIVKEGLSQDKNVISGKLLRDSLIEDHDFDADDADEMINFVQDKELKALNNSSMEDYEVNTTSYVELLNSLNEENKVPAIIFNFSRKKCAKLANSCANKVEPLLSDEEKEVLKEEYEKFNDSVEIKDPSFDLQALFSGISVHHSGLLPEYKKFIEKMFEKKLIKVVFATSTLAAGINMPAKTTVLSELQKFNGFGRVDLTPSEFQQMSGRAGRRGIDKLGNVILMPDNSQNLELGYNLANASPDNIDSKYKSSYTSMLNFFESYNDFELFNKILEKSFYKFQQSEDDKNNEVLKETKSHLKMLSEFDYISKDNPRSFSLTPKGQIAKSILGINSIALTEFITNKNTVQLTPEHFAGIISSMLIDKETGEYKINSADILPDNNDNPNVKLFSDYKRAEFLLEHVGLDDFNMSNIDEIKASLNSKKLDAQKDTNISKIKQEKKELSDKLRIVDVMTSSEYRDMDLHKIISIISKNKHKQGKTTLNINLLKKHINELNAVKDNSSKQQNLKFLNNALEDIHEVIENAKSLKEKREELEGKIQYQKNIDKALNALNKINNTLNSKFNGSKEAFTSFMEQGKDDYYKNVSLRKMSKEISKINEMQESLNINDGDNFIQLKPGLCDITAKWVSADENLSDEFEDCSREFIDQKRGSFCGDYYKNLSLTIDIINQISKIADKAKNDNDTIGLQNWNKLSSLCKESLGKLKKPPMTFIEDNTEHKQDVA